MSSQAERIVSHFGGVRPLARVIGYTPATVHRWLYPKERGGTGGRIPVNAQEKLQAAAELMGLEIPAEDWML